MKHMKALALWLLAVPVFAACPSGFIQITDPYLTPTGAAWTGSIVYTLAYSTTTAAATISGQQGNFNVVSGISICLAPGLYTPVTQQQSGSNYRSTTAWTVPVSGGPYTVAQIQGTVQLVPISATGPITYNSGTGAIGLDLGNINGSPTSSSYLMEFYPSTANTPIQGDFFPTATGSAAYMELWNGPDRTQANNAAVGFEMNGNSVLVGTYVAGTGSGQNPTAIYIGGQKDTVVSLQHIYLTFDGTAILGTLTDASGNFSMTGTVAAKSGATTVYRCSVAGTLRVGQMTTVAGDCGTAVDTGFRSN